MLRRLYDPDIHGSVMMQFLEESPRGLPNCDSSFTRSEFRHALWHEVRGSHSRPNSRLLSTVDLPSALVDASQLALEHLVETNVLKAGLRAGVERFANS